jgi:hypothetical protein
MTRQDTVGGGVALTCQQREHSILKALSRGCEDLGYFSFKSLSRSTGLDRRQVRLDVRRLARKGFAQYGKGLWTDDGDLAGAGYAITDAGRAALKPAGGE